MAMFKMCVNCGKMHNIYDDICPYCNAKSDEGKHIKSIIYGLAIATATAFYLAYKEYKDISKSNINKPIELPDELNDSYREK